jgi:hypothetical protein
MHGHVNACDIWRGEGVRRPGRGAGANVSALVRKAASQLKQERVARFEH